MIDKSGNIAPPPPYSERPPLVGSVVFDTGRPIRRPSQTGYHHKYNPTFLEILYTTFGPILAIVLFLLGLYLPFIFFSFDTKVKEMNFDEIGISDRTVLRASKGDFFLECIGVTLACFLWVVAILLSIVSIHENDLIKKKLYSQRAKDFGIAGGVFCGVALIHFLGLMFYDGKNEIATVWFISSQPPKSEHIYVQTYTPRLT